MIQRAPIITAALAIIVACSTAMAQTPPARGSHVMTSAGPNGGVLLFGGASTGAPRLSDSLWMWNGTAWRVLSDAGPHSRSLAAAAFDTRRGVMVVYGGGGIGSGTRYGDTWEWNGRAWQERSVRTPGSRDHHAMAYDEARGNTVMYGGQNADRGSFTNDTWTWDGTTWTLADTTTGPGGVGHLAMAYDSRRQRVVLFGGDGADNRETGDVFEWDGVKWTRIAAEGPGPRTRHRLAYDPVRGVTVLYGGQTGRGRGAVFPQDTWTWDGSKWERRATVGPPSRYLPAMAYDTVRQRVVMFGGSNGGPPYNSLGDTWEWDGARWEKR